MIFEKKICVKKSKKKSMEKQANKSSFHTVVCFRMRVKRSEKMAKRVLLCSQKEYLSRQSKYQR